MLRWIPIALLALFLGLTDGAGAGATATPDTTNRGTTLGLDYDLTAPPVSGRVPRSTTLTIQRGFRFDGRAVAARCTVTPEGNATDNRCPPRSRIGTATVTATAFGQTFPVEVGLFLGAPLQSGDLGSVVGVASLFGQTASGAGRLLMTGQGLRAVIASPDELSQYDGLGVTVDHLTATVGAKRRVKGRRRDLIRTPRTCAGTWAASAVLSFGDGTNATLDSQIPCASSR